LFVILKIFFFFKKPPIPASPIDRGIDCAVIGRAGEAGGFGWGRRRFFHCQTRKLCRFTLRFLGAGCNWRLV